MLVVGSIAWVDKGGLLNIGPESAGSHPGPVAYGLGNDRPTVTDANVVLGRIDPDNPIGGKLERLDVEAAKRAIDEHIGRPLGLDILAAAEAIFACCKFSHGRCYSPCEYRAWI